MVVAIKENRNEEEPSFSDPEDYIDEITNEELLPELMLTRSRLDESIDRIIVIDNIPKVGQEKLVKLKRIINELLQKCGTIINEYFPDENGVTKGYMFVEFSTDQAAIDAQAYFNGYSFDKNHIFKTNFFQDFDTYSKLNLNEKFEEPTPLPYNDPGNLNWWLTANECYDQFAILHGDFTSVFLNTPLKPQELDSRDKWTPTRFEWSPRGTYLATFHDKGIALWAGEKFKQYMRFSHAGVQFIDFSPCERFLVTFNPMNAGVNDRALIIWDTITGQKRRSFTYTQSSMPWPFFKWNHDDSFFAKLAGDSIYVYESETFSLVNKEAIKIPNIRNFEWSPINNYIAYWVGEVKNVLARVVIYDVATKTEIRSKNLVNVAKCQIYWQSSGDYVCVRVDRYKKINNVEDEDKKYSGISHNFEIFRMKEKQIPVDPVEIKGAFKQFGWEPNGNKFCIIYSEGQNKNTAAFYRIEKATPITPGKIELIKELKNKNYTKISWSPQGQYSVLAAYGPECLGVPTVEFYDVSNNVLLFNKVEHDHMSEIEWDPTGRYLVSSVKNDSWKTDNGYILWSFQGKQIYKQNYEKLLKFSWRPRPPSLLTEDHKKEIRKNFKSYEQKYYESDLKYQSRVSTEILEKRRALMKDYSRFKSDSSTRYAETKSRRLELRNGYDTDRLINDDEYVEYTVQFLVESKKEEVDE